jgi:hypothetical protein
MLELLLALSGPISPPRLPVAVVVVSLDDATQGQIRYGRSVVATAGGDNGSFEFTPPPLDEAAFRACIDKDIERAATCARFYIGHENAREARPPIVVVLLADATADDEFKAGQLQVSCVGVGEAPNSPERQTIRLWPDAVRVHGMNDLLADRNAITGCIAGAGAESGW